MTTVTASAIAIEGSRQEVRTGLSEETLWLPALLPLASSTTARTSNRRQSDLHRGGGTWLLQKGRGFQREGVSDRTARRAEGRQEGGGGVRSKVT